MAGWFDSNSLYRTAISVDATGVAAGTLDFGYGFPPTMDQFWNNVQSTGKDIIVTLADGVTEITSSRASAFDLAAGGAFNVTTRTGGVRVEALQSGDFDYSSNNLFWMYWGDATSTLHTFGTYGGTEVQTRYNVMAPKFVHPRIRTRPELPGETTPRVQVSKISTEVQYLYWDFGGELLPRESLYNGRRLAEGIQSVITQSMTGGGAAAVIDSNVRFMDAGVFRSTVTGGTDAVDYTLEAKAVTTIGRTLTRRALLKVRDPDDQ